MSAMPLAGLLGGVGLFLLGMRLMTDGLRLAAGRALRTVLERWTRTPLRGVLSGALITAIVQSSSAVTVAAIGFVNAGLMSLAQAVAVIFGSNVGTTMTGWLVAGIGLQVDVRAFALPAIGVGMALRLTGGGGRRAPLGEALAGFGIFFLGIDVLKATFAGLEVGGLPTFRATGVGGALLFAGAGFLLTLLMQSSSAALAVVLTAAGGGVVPLGSAAAMVIGANLGTTSTAALAVIGATSNAKRVAAAHVAFNGITGFVALLMLPLLLAGLVAARRFLALESEPAAVLAGFHTLFNLLGVALLLPFTGLLVRVLEQRFRTPEEDEARPRYLDRNVVATPVLAMHALVMELARVGSIARRMGRGALAPTPASPARLAADRSALQALVEKVGEFSSRMRRSHLPAELDEVLPNALRVSRYYAEVAELAEAIDQARRQAEPPPVEDLAQEVDRFRDAAAAFLDGAGLDVPGYSPQACADALERLQGQYQGLKAELLRAGTQGRLSVRDLVDQLDLLSNVRRLVQQAERGTRYLCGLDTVVPEERTAQGVRSGDAAA